MEELFVKLAFALMVVFIAITAAVILSGCTPQLDDGWQTVITRNDRSEKLKSIGPCSCLERPNGTIEACYCEPPKH